LAARTAKNLEFHGVLEGKASIELRLNATIEDGKRMSTLLEAIQDAVRANADGLTKGLKAASDATNAIAAKFTGTSGELSGRLDAAEASLQRCDAGVTDATDSARAASESARKRCAEIEMVIHRMQRIQAMSAVTTKCIACHPVQAGLDGVFKPSRNHDGEFNSDRLGRLGGPSGYRASSPNRASSPSGHPGGALSPTGALPPCTPPCTPPPSAPTGRRTPLRASSTAVQALQSVAFTVGSIGLAELSRLPPTDPAEANTWTPKRPLTARSRAVGA